MRELPPGLQPPLQKSCDIQNEEISFTTDFPGCNRLVNILDSRLTF